MLDDQLTQYDSPEATAQHTLADCNKACQELLPMFRSGCELGCRIDNPPKISEKLAAAANNLLIESEQLSSMAASLELMDI